MTALASHPADIARPTEAQPARAEAQPHTRTGGSALGLVPSSTTHTGGAQTQHPYEVALQRFEDSDGPKPLAIDAKLQRARKMKAAVMTAARLIDSAPIPGFRTHWLMVTLTLRKGSKIEPRDIEKFITTVRNWLARKHPGYPAPLRYVWVMELMKSGAPHYHVLLNLPVTAWMPKPDRKRWWKLGSTEIAVARHAVAYIAKYASKGVEPGSKPFPKGMRIQGNGGLTKDARRELRWWLAPKWAREAFPDVTLADLRRVVGGFIDRFTDTLAESPWIVILRGGVPHLLRKQPCLNA